MLWRDPLLTGEMFMDPTVTAYNTGATGPTDTPCMAEEGRCVTIHSVNNALPENAAHTRYRHRPSVLEQLVGLRTVGLIIALCVTLVVVGLALSSPWIIAAGYTSLFSLQVLAIWPSGRPCG